MTTYLFIGLILILAAYLVKARRGRGDGSTGATPRRGRTSRAPAVPSSPMPAAVAAAESAAARAPQPRIGPAPASQPEPMGEPAMSWTPGETIAEPGWPLPGEISGGWSTTPSSPPPAFSEQTPPVPVVEWQPMAAPAVAGADAPVAEAELPGTGEWAMPSMDAAEPAGSGPPMWTPDAPASEPGAGTTAPIDPSAIWLAEPAATSAPTDGGIAAWQPEAAEVPDAPPLEWSAPTVPPQAAGGAPGPELAWASGPSIAPEPEPEPPASAWESPSIDPEPEPEPPASAWESPSIAPEPETEPPASAWESPSIDPEPETGAGVAEAAPAADPIAGETPAPSPVPEWIAAAAPEHAAFAAAIFEVPVPLPHEPLTGTAGEEATAPAAVAAEDPAPGPVWMADPAPVAPVSAPAPAPLAGLVPLTDVCDHLGVTPRMLALMRILADTPMSVGGLARSLSVSRPLIADLCTRLQAAGLAEREPDDADRRRVRVVLTEAGHLLCAETAASPETGSYEAVLAGLSPAERAQLRITLWEMDEIEA